MVVGRQYLLVHGTTYVRDSQHKLGWERLQINRTDYYQPNT